MAETLATVTQDSGFTAVVTQTGLTFSSTNLANPAVLETVSEIGDVDAVNKVDGSILVYKTTTNKWTSTTTLDAQNMEGGEF
jgi:hypothetical protein